MLLAFPTILWKLKLLRINLIWKKEKKEEVHISLFGQKIYSLIGTFWLFQEKHLGSKLPSLNYQIIKKRKKKKEKRKKKRIEIYYMLSKFGQFWFYSLMFKSFDLIPLSLVPFGFWPFCTKKR